jgi:hypothetical protein
MNAPETTDHSLAVAMRHGAEPSHAAPTLHGTEDLLAQAAALAVERGSELEEFMRAAWNAFVDAQPGLRQQIEEMQLFAEFARLRQSGRMPVA